MSIGETLARARQDAGLSITQISQQTRIRETVIRGIEHDDFTACGGDFYARGHIRSVAAMVGADADPLIQEYDTTHGGARQAAAETPGPGAPLRLPRRRRADWSVTIGLVIAVIVICGVVHAGEHPSHDANAAIRHKPVLGPTPAPPTRRAARGAAPGQPHRPVLVQLATAEGCWVGVYAADGTLKWQAYIPAGAARSWVFACRVSMKIGNPREVVLTVNGHRINSPGSQAMTLNL